MSNINKVILNSHVGIFKFVLVNLQKLLPWVEFDFLASNNYCALGATILAHKSNSGVVASDYLPYSLGVCLYNGTLRKLIQAKTYYPCKGRHIFKTVRDNQQTIRVKIYEGEKLFARSCKPIGEIVARDLPELPAGKLKCEISLVFDKNGILTSEARSILYFGIEKLKTNFYPCSVDDACNENLTSSADDLQLLEKLESLDIFIGTVQTDCETQPEENRLCVLNKLNQAKLYINKNRFTISANECDQLKFELEECAEENSIIKKSGGKKNINQTNSNSNTTINSKITPAKPKSSFISTICILS
jgi:molecular chaperone DnaK (HSP70)